jgi:TPP-dependent 2-oxoacid decarboxylase
MKTLIQKLNAASSWQPSVLGVDFGKPASQRRVAGLFTSVDLVIGHGMQMKNCSTANYALFAQTERVLAWHFSSTAVKWIGFDRLTNLLMIAFQALYPSTLF